MNIELQCINTININKYNKKAIINTINTIITNKYIKISIFYIVANWSDIPQFPGIYIRVASLCVVELFNGGTFKLIMQLLAAIFVYLWRRLHNKIV